MSRHCPTFSTKTPITGATAKFVRKPFIPPSISPNPMLTNVPQQQSGRGEPDSYTKQMTAIADITKHILWFDDGNITLIAQDVAFRIYRSLLAAQSTVFADMFASAIPSADECMDGCPAVHVSDSSEDLAHLLRVLLPGSRRLYVSYSLA